MNFVNINEIDDVNAFLANCLCDGFNIAKYGVSPQDNFKKENKPFINEKQKELTETNKQEEITSPKKKIKIIKK